MGKSITYHGAVRDKADQRVLWQQAQAHDQRLFQGGEAVCLLAHVHHIEEDWRRWGGPGEAVFDGGVRGV